MPNKLTNEEIGALLGAFSDIRNELPAGILQTKLFKMGLIFSNLYVIFFTILYLLLMQNLLTVFKSELLGGDFLALFSGKTSVMFWLIASVNITVYFNIGFRIACLCSMIYFLNSTVDNIVLFKELGSQAETLYLSLFIFTVPLQALAMAVMLFTHKSSTEKW